MNNNLMKASFEDSQLTASMVGESCEPDYPLPRVSPSAAPADIPGESDRGANTENDTAKAASTLNDALSLAGMPCSSRHPLSSTSSTLTPSLVPSIGALTSPNINTQFRTLTPRPGFDHHQSSPILADDFNISDDLRNSDNSVSLEDLISVVGEDLLYDLSIPSLTQQVQQVTRSQYNNAIESLFPELVGLDTMHTTTSPVDSWDAFTPQSSVQSFNSPTTPQSDELFPDLGMSYQVNGQAQDIPYFPPASRPTGSYCPMPQPTSQQILNYQQNDAYSNFNWMSLPLLSQNDPSYAAAPPNAVYPTFGTGYSSSGQAPPTMTSSNTNAYNPTYEPSNYSSTRPQLGRLPQSNSQPTVPTMSSFRPSSVYLTRAGTPAYSQASQSRSSTTSPNSTPQGDRPSSTVPSSNLDPISIPLPDGSRRCSYPGCTSRALFTRGCDLRKHYNRHQKHLYCRLDPSCPQSAASCAARKDGGGGFSSNKDRARHEAKHNPRIQCEWRGTDEHGREVRCERMFSRVDNMKDHVRRIHMKGDRDKDTARG